MADTSLILGPVRFRDFEIPEQINFGASLREKEHKLIGSNRVIDVMGIDPSPLKWRGQFRGTDAVGRAETLLALQATGAELPVSWGGIFRLVVIKHFEPHFRRFYEVPYEIELTVVDGGFGAVMGLVGPLTSVISADIGAIVSLAEGL